MILKYFFDQYLKIAEEEGEDIEKIKKNKKYLANFKLQASKIKKELTGV